MAATVTRPLVQQLIAEEFGAAREVEQARALFETVADLRRSSRIF